VNPNDQTNKLTDYSNLTHDRFWSLNRELIAPAVMKRHDQEVEELRMVCEGAIHTLKEIQTMWHEWAMRLDLTRDELIQLNYLESNAKAMILGVEDEYKHQ